MTDTPLDEGYRRLRIHLVSLKKTRLDMHIRAAYQAS